MLRPSEDNSRTAIVKAAIETERGHFEGLGDAVPRFGLTIGHECYAQPRDGNQMFHVLTCRNGRREDWGPAFGLHFTYDRSRAASLDSGSRVFVCDNFAFHGESQVCRKLTANAFRDLPDLMCRMLAEAFSM